MYTGVWVGSATLGSMDLKAVRPRQ